MEAIEVIRIYANDNFNMDDVSLAVNMPKGEKNKIMDVVGQDDIFRSIVKINSNMPFLFFYLLKVNLSDVKLVCKNLKILSQNDFNLGMALGEKDFFSILLSRFDSFNDLNIVEIIECIQSLLSTLVVTYERLLSYPKKVRLLCMKKILLLKDPLSFYLSSQKPKNYIGKGAYGQVARSVDEKTGEQYAVKVNQTSRKKYDVYGFQYLGELNTMKTIKHPNIIKCFFSGVGEKTEEKSSDMYSIYGMPLATSDLKEVDVLQVTEQRRLQWLFEIFSAIHFLHSKGFYHCDLKAENILLIDDKMVIADLGLSNFRMKETVGPCASISSPQMQWNRRLPLAEKEKLQEDKTLKKFIKVASQPIVPILEDMWALGYVTYFMFTGRYFSTNFLFLAKMFANFDEFVEKRTQECRISPSYQDSLKKMLKKMLSISHENRKSDLLKFLKYPIFDGRGAYIEGEIVKPTLVYPLPEGEVNDLIIKEFLQRVIDIEGFSYFVKFHIIDLFYRLYEVCAEFGFKKLDIFLCIILTSCSVIDIETYQKVFQPFQQLEQVLACQKFLINICNGHFTRPCLADFITKPKKQKNALLWLQENPRAYYNLPLPDLVSKLN